MKKYRGKRIGDLSRLSLKELRDNISVDVNEYVDRKGIYQNGMYFIDVPFKNGEWVKAVLDLQDDRIKLIFVNNSVIMKRARNS